MTASTKSAFNRQFGGEPGILQVFFHGTFVFDFHTDYIDVLIPEVDEHVYRVGSWLGETELQCGEPHGDEPHGGDHGAMEETMAHGGHQNGISGPDVFELKGVEPGSKTTLPEQHNLMFSVPLPANVDDLLRARIRVPLPDSISTPRRGILAANGFSDPALLRRLGYFGELGTIQIFTYHFQNDNALSLTCHPGHSLWEPAFAGDTLGLHIFAAPEEFHVLPSHTGRQSSHIQNAFAHCMAVLGQSLTMDRLPDQNVFERGDLPEGALPEETEDLAPRLRRLRQLGRMRKDNRDLNQLWFASEAFDGDPDGCSSTGNRRN